MNKEQLQARINGMKENIKSLKVTVSKYETELDKLESHPTLYMYESLDDAEGYLWEILRERAFQDCEGSGNCGDEYYEQEFIVDGILYNGKLEVEYNRHDKTYYYIDGTKWSYVEIGPWKGEE
jgi:predicted nuclease with TOPRIM domain